ncbi:MAG: LpqB family beta-propeller domain-containing protein [Terrimesophilobacter sp.]
MSESPRRRRNFAVPGRWGSGTLQATIVVCVAVGLSACGGIPDAGPVNSGPSFGEQPSSETIFNPIGPAQDATQRSILEGFIAAFTGTQGDYGVARQFLSSSFKKEWNPRTSVLIRSGAPVVTSVDDSTMEYAFTTSAQLDEFGAYTSAALATQRLTFTLVQEKGQWRISQAPDGIVLAESTFLTIFAKHALYFYDLSLQHLVPDQRWFPGGTTATRIVTSLLAGPPDWLKGAVVSQIPDGTQLSQGTTVTVEGTLAQVDLTTAAAAANARQRQLMQLQISESLSTVPGIGSVELSVAGSVLAIDPIGPDAPVATPSVDSRPLVLADGKFGYVAGDAITEIAGLSEKMAVLNPSAATLGALGTAAAARAKDGVYVVRTGQIPVKKVDSRAGLIAPSLDQYGYVWSVPRVTPNAMEAFDFNGTAFPVTMALPVDSQIVSFAISRDNARIAILLQTQLGARLVVAAIVRDAAQGFVPTSVGRPVMDIGLDESAAIGVTWVDAYSVATLTEQDGVDFVTNLEIGGQQTSLGRPTSSVAIVGGNGRSGLRVLGEDHLLQAPRGSSWQKTSIKAEMIATQR